MKPLAILETGMITGVGLSTEATCAAIRVGITGFVDTNFMYDGEFIQGSPVPLESPHRGRQKLIEMAKSAICEAIAPLKEEDYPIEDVPLLLCVGNSDRAGRFPNIDESLLGDISNHLELTFNSASTVIHEGRIGGVKAIAQARQLIDDDRKIRRVLICGVDTLLVTESLNHYYAERRLLTAENSDGFIPGEAAAAVLLGPISRGSTTSLAVTGVGFHDEPAPINSEKPLRADGLVGAIREAVADAEISYEKLAYRLTDNSGEQYGFKEAALAMTRVVRPVKPEFDIEHPADCIGEVGAATVPVLLAVANMAEMKSYAPGRSMGDGVICHIGDDGPARAAFVLRAISELSGNQRRTA